MNWFYYHEFLSDLGQSLMKQQIFLSANNMKLLLYLRCAMLYSIFTKVIAFSGHCLVKVLQDVQVVGMKFFVTTLGDTNKVFAAYSHHIGDLCKQVHLGSRVQL